MTSFPLSSSSELMAEDETGLGPPLEALVSVSRGSSGSARPVMASGLVEVITSLVSTSSGGHSALSRESSIQGSVVVAALLARGLYSDLRKARTLWMADSASQGVGGA